MIIRGIGTKDFVRATDCSSKHFAHYGKGSRELLPMPILPVSAEITYGTALPTDCCRMMDELVSVSVTALNFMFLGKASPTVHRTSNAAQRAAATNLQRRWIRLAIHVSADGVKPARDPGALQRTIDRGMGGRSVRLRADIVDSLPSCAEVDPLPHIPEEFHGILTDPDRLCPPLIGSCAAHVDFSGGARVEYIRLVRAQCRSGKLELAPDSRFTADIFGVAKEASGRQRGVWNGAELADLAVRPPIPPMLGNPSDLNVLEASDDQPIFLSKRDGRSFFDQLHMDPALRELFGTPCVTRDELMNPAIRRSEDVNTRPLTPAELVKFGTTKAVDCSILVPRFACWPMGASWASFVAQSVMTNSLRQAGASAEQFLWPKGGLPEAGQPAVSVATDDVLLFERNKHSGPDADPGKHRLLRELERRWRHDGIEGNAGKSLDRSPSGKALGRSLVDGRYLMPTSARVRDFLNTLYVILGHGSISPSDFEHVVGVANWMLLGFRPMLSCLGSAYGFADANVTEERRIPASVRKELTLVACLFPGLVFDLRASWSGSVFATDGAQSHGFGGAATKCGPDIARHLASMSRSDPRSFVMRGVEPHAGEQVLPISLAMSDFHEVFSIKSPSMQPACKMEVDALQIMIQHLARSPGKHRSRIMGLVDATALKQAVQKGRSSSPYFRVPIRRIAALCIAGELDLHLGHVVSRSNPADAPSRGVHITRKARKKGVSDTRSLVHKVHVNKRAWRRIFQCRNAPSHWLPPSWCTSCSASSLAQPSLR